MFRLANGFDECSPLLSVWGKHTRHFARCRNGHTDLQTCFFVHKLRLDHRLEKKGGKFELLDATNRQFDSSALLDPGECWQIHG